MFISQHDVFNAIVFHKMKLIRCNICYLSLVKPRSSNIETYVLWIGPEMNIHMVDIKK